MAGISGDGTMSAVEFSVIPSPPATIMAQAISAIERKAKDLCKAGLQTRDVLADLTARGHGPWTVDKLRCVARAEGVLEVEIPRWMADCQKFGWVPQASPSLASAPTGGETSASSDGADGRDEELERGAAYDYEPDFEADAPSVGPRARASAQTVMAVGPVSSLRRLDARKPRAPVRSPRMICGAWSSASARSPAAASSQSRVTRARTNGKIFGARANAPTLNRPRAGARPPDWNRPTEEKTKSAHRERAQRVRICFRKKRTAHRGRSTRPCAWHSSARASTQYPSTARRQSWRGGRP